MYDIIVLRYVDLTLVNLLNQTPICELGTFNNKHIGFIFYFVILLF